MLFFGAIFLMIHSGNTRDDTNHICSWCLRRPIRKALWKEMVSQDRQPRAAEIKLSQWTFIAGKLVRNLIHCFEEPCFSPFYHWFWCCFHRKRVQHHCFCNVLQLFSPYFHWRNFHDLAKNNQKHRVFHRLVLVSTLFWP